MAEIQYHFDGQASGATVTSANSGALSGYPTGTSGFTCLYSSTTAKTGPCGILFSTVTSGNAVARFPFGSTTTAWAVHVHYKTSWPSSSHTIISVRDSAGAVGSVFRFNIDSTGRCWINTAASSNNNSTQWGYIQASGGGNLILANGTQYRIELKGTINSTTGSFGCEIFASAADSTTRLNDAGAASVKTSIDTANGAASVDYVDLGKIDSNAGTPSPGFDELITQTTNTYKGVYQIDAIDVFSSSSTVTATGWTNVSTPAISNAAVLGDNDTGTYLQSPNTPTNSIVSGNIQAIAQPASDFVVTVKCNKTSATSGTLVGKLYTVGGTLIATSDTGTIPDSTGDVTLTFSSANLASGFSGASVTDVPAAWASGLRLDLLSTAA